MPCAPNYKSCCLSSISCPRAESGQCPAHKGADAATAAVGCSAPFLPPTKQDMKGYLAITAVPVLKKDSPRALEVPRDMPRVWLQSYTPTPQPCSTHRLSLLLQPPQQKVLTQQPALLAPSAPHELPPAAKPCSIPLTPTVTQRALGTPRDSAEPLLRTHHTRSGSGHTRHRGTHTNMWPHCGGTAQTCRTWPEQNQAKPGLHIPLQASHHCLFTCRSAHKGTHDVVMQTEMSLGKLPVE